MNHFILFKLAARCNPEGFVNLVNAITQKVNDKENYKILVSSDIDDSTMYNAATLNRIKPLIESKKVIMCFDAFTSKKDAINRDMKLLTDWDIVVNLSDKIECVNSNFDEEIRTLLLSQYPDKNGKVNYAMGHKNVEVIGRKYYDKQGYITDGDIKNKHNLIVNYYFDKNIERGTELDFCLLENISNPHINKVVVICTENDYNHLLEFTNNDNGKIIPIITEKRPTFNDYFAITKKLFNSDDNINIISNLDVIIPHESLSQIENADIHKVVLNYFPNISTCLALSRWDVANKSEDFKNGAVLFDRADSQDTWIFKGGVNQVLGADFTMGIAGCDNSIAHLLEQHGYNVINPSRTIKTYHLHLTNIRNYTDISGHAIQRIQPPYKLINPTE
jgi:hypothetical protein